jgi:hypothetical protein
LALAAAVICVTACTPATTDLASGSAAPPQGTAPAPSQDAALGVRLGAGQLPASGFQIANGRVLSQSGENTALVQVTRLGTLPENILDVRRAAERWCGRAASVSRTSQDRVGLSVRRTYLVRCR